MISFDDFISFSAFINVLSILSALFWSFHSLTEIPKEDILRKSYLSSYIIGFVVRFFMVMLTASFVNQAAEVPRDMVVSLPGLFPKHYLKLKIYLRREFKQQGPVLTLWKIYKINESLLISAIGTLITYGIILGTLETVTHSIETNDSPLNS
ncbi:uncharacterized protein NPIL_22201 [Nephila pilipes]|uniref:Uncharacterized protein n=1 Tax=Nephila pilipes TaxID=299642 RepID=A0A8X6MRZ3_NEPPI|nr:uncharacterized protein NPIL_22201 [Nephila pilipes]